VLHILTHQPFDIVDLLLAEIEDVITDGMGVARQLPYGHWISYICSWIAPDEGVASTYHDIEFGAYSRFVSPLLVLIVWIVFKFFHFIQLLFIFRCVVINHQKGGDCAHLGPEGMFR
jgi:hypothetical protein